jgi:hypothetical protein
MSSSSPDATMLDAKFQSLKTIGNAVVYNFIGLCYTLWVRYRLNKKEKHGAMTTIAAIIGVLADLGGLMLISEVLKGNGPPQNVIASKPQLYTLLVFNILELIVDLILVYRAFTDNVNGVSVPFIPKLKI